MKKRLAALFLVLALLLAVLPLSAAAADEPAEATPPEAETLVGDVNGDGKINNRDVILLFRHVAEQTAAAAPETLDVTGDGVVDNSDATLLFRYVSGYDTALWANSDETDVLDYAANTLLIGFADGDDENHVTRDLILPAQAEGASVSWSSTESAIDSSGHVTRPDGEDKAVELTAVLTFGDLEKSKSFPLIVMAAHTPGDLLFEDISGEEFLAKNEEGFIEKNEDGRIAAVIGAYTDKPITDAETAQASLGALQTILGITDTEEEFVCDGMFADSVLASYSFDQMHDGKKVYGRTVTVLTDPEGSSMGVNSSYASIGAYRRAQISEAEAVGIARSAALRRIYAGFGNLR